MDPAPITVCWGGFIRMSGILRTLAVMVSHAISTHGSYTKADEIEN